MMRAVERRGVSVVQLCRMSDGCFEEDLVDHEFLMLFQHKWVTQWIACLSLSNTHSGNWMRWFRGWRCNLLVAGFSSD